MFGRKSVKSRRAGQRRVSSLAEQVRQMLTETDQKLILMVRG